MVAVSRRLRKVAFRGASRTRPIPTAPIMPVWTGIKRVATGDEIVTWNTAPGYVHDRRYETPLYERVCNCGLATGETCNCVL